MSRLRWLAALMAASAVPSRAQDFSINNGQIFTPGFVVLNSPQPDTPMGGDTLHVSMDVTGNGQLPLSEGGDDEDLPSMIHNIFVFLYSYDTGRNFTVTNGTATANEESLGDILEGEEGSTVKHIDWTWPDCLAGDGEGGGDRGNYNISIRQSFRLNGEDHYTITDVPIAISNGIDDNGDRPACEVLDNELLDPGEIDAAAANSVGVFLEEGTEIDTGDGGDDGNGGDDGGDDGGNEGGDNEDEGDEEDGDEDQDQDQDQDEDEDEGGVIGGGGGGNGDNDNGDENENGNGNGNGDDQNNGGEENDGGNEENNGGGGDQEDDENNGDGEGENDNGNEQDQDNSNNNGDVVNDNNNNNANNNQDEDNFNDDQDNQGGDDQGEPDFGGQREEAGPEDGLGAGTSLGVSWGLLLVGLFASVQMLC